MRQSADGGGHVEGGCLDVKWESAEGGEGREVGMAPSFWLEQLSEHGAIQ